MKPVPLGQARKSAKIGTAGFEDVAASVMTFAPASDAEVIKLLRSRFPRRSLRMRVTALDFLLRRRSAGIGQAYRPR